MAGRCGCQKGCSCCTTASPTIGWSGGGGAGACFVGSVKISSIEGNRVGPAADGLYALLCATAPNGDAVERTDDGCLILPPPVIRASGGAIIAPGEDGSVLLPASTAPAFACGLQTDEDDVLSVAVSGSWAPFDLLGRQLGGDESGGSEIYCHVETGQIRGYPIGTAISAGAVGTPLAAGLLAVPGTYASPSGGIVTITNPSLARFMLVMRFVTMAVDAVAPPLADLDLTLQERINGGGWGSVRTGRAAQLQTGTTQLRSNTQISAWRASIIAPGDSITVETRLYAEKLGSGSDPTLVEATVSNRLMGVSQ